MPVTIYIPISCPAGNPFSFVSTVNSWFTEVDKLGLRFDVRLLCTYATMRKIGTMVGGRYLYEGKDLSDSFAGTFCTSFDLTDFSEFLREDNYLDHRIAIMMAALSRIDSPMIICDASVHPNYSADGIALPLIDEPIAILQASIADVHGRPQVPICGELGVVSVPEIPFDVLACIRPHNSLREAFVIDYKQAWLRLAEIEKNPELQQFRALRAYSIAVHLAEAKTINPLHFTRDEF